MTVKLIIDRHVITGLIRADLIHPLWTRNYPVSAPRGRVRKPVEMTDSRLRQAQRLPVGRSGPQGSTFSMIWTDPR